MQLLNVPRLAYFLEPNSRRSLGRGRCPDLAGTSTNNPALYTLTPTDSEQPSSLYIHTAETSAPESALDKEKLFRDVVREYGSSLYYFVLQRVGHPDDAAEIAQQAFAEAACSLTSYRGEAELSTWIFGIATNLTRNYISRAPQRRHRFETDEILEGCESLELQPCENLSQRQGLKLVSEAMNMMSPEMAQALTMIAIDELSYEEAALELDVPVGTVRSRVSRARGAVRQHLRSAGYFPAEV
jgi:RNA polymerase sigma-70 factor (ECF subfamily)